MKNARARAEVEPTIIELSALMDNNKFWYEICGSYRRGKEVLGDIDIVTDIPLNVFEKTISKMSPKFISGKDKKRSYIINDIQIDVYHTNDIEKGAMTLFLTGSKEFNIHMRIVAKKMGMKLSQYGLYNENGRLDTPTEESIFNSLHMSFVPPMDRS
jgi:DNA polymerase (family X)